MDSENNNRPDSPDRGDSDRSRGNRENTESTHSSAEDFPQQRGAAGLVGPAQRRKQCRAGFRAEHRPQYQFRGFPGFVQFAGFQHQHEQRIYRRSGQEHGF